MTQEEKDLLLIDLSARLPYRVQVFVEHDKYGQATLLGVNTKQFSITVGDYNWSCTSNIEGHRIEQYKQLIKPYLRSMSSMTEEEKEELLNLLFDKEAKYFYIDEEGLVDGKTSDLMKEGLNYPAFCPINIVLYTDWLNAHHLDYRGLIPMGLALEAPEDMYK